jgi:hypothetical protein
MPQEGNTKHACVVRISYTLSRDTTQIVHLDFAKNTTS